MTEDKAGAAAAAPGSKKKNPRRGGRGRRRANRRNKAKPQQGGKSAPNNKQTHTPPTPQVKVTIRNIQNSSQYGSVKSILHGLMPKLLEKCSSNQYSFDVDNQVVRALIDEEEKVNEYKAAEKKRMEGVSEDVAEEEATNETGDEAEKNEVSPEMEEEGATETQQPAAAKEAALDVIVAPKVASGLPTVTVRPLYVIPARKTKRRGERPGTAYILLIAPKIEEVPAVIAKETADTVAKEGENASDDKKDITERTTKPAEPVAPTKSVDYTRQFARNRLLLDNVLGSLTQIAADDFKTQEHFAGCIVEQSLNGKVLKAHTGPPDRREGTIENTPDFKKWLESLEEQKETLKSRPKPAPGGGVLFSTSGEGADGGQEMSVLVQHLRAKKEEIKKRKALKKKKDGGKAKSKKERLAEAKKAGRGGGASGGKKDADGKKKFKKRKKKPRGPKPAAVAVLKPPGS